MTRLIDADALLEALKDLGHFADDDYIVETITNASTVQREGWVSVPIEPTEEMLRVGCEAGLDFKTLMDDTPYATDLAVYKAMIKTYVNE